ncbi:LolA-related protein [Novilysobacter erysipheiresistens]|uniref:LolA-related protein n=1 Tax=Novilysobacter erysipheiresistens TaxID=1749332 RepID=A0ABU7YXF4_9GAMM
MPSTGVLLAGVLLAMATPGHARPLPAAPEQARADGAAAAVEADWILDKLARPAPMRTAFVELRESRLLKNPLRLSGEYRRPADDVLVREVRAPYAETTTIHAGEATIERAAKSPRTFSLSRAPELAGLQASFGALLSGDRAGLAEHYTIDSDGSRQRWTLTLVPKHAELAAQLRDIVLYGRGAELRCIETRTPDAAEPQRTLLAGAARAAAEVDDAAGFAALCHGDGATTQ